MNDKSDGCKMVADKKEKTGVFPGYVDISKTALQFGDRQDGWLMTDNTLTLGCYVYVYLYGNTFVVVVQADGKGFEWLCR